MEVAPHFQRTTNSLDDLYVKSSNGGQVPLNTFTTFTTQPTSLSIGHQGQFPSTTISFNLANGKSIGDAVDAINKAVEGMHLPMNVNVAFQGTAAAFEASLTNEPLLILAALITVYIVLGVLYESYIHPVTILSTLPSAGVGAILALLITGNRPLRHRAYRNHPSHRHREEERHHDDRLRARSRARAGHDSRRSHLSSLPSALPPHHDDHDGRAPRRRSAGLRLGHRLRAPRSTRHHHHRRPAHLAGAHALHHPGRLLFFDRIGRKYLGTAKADEEFYEHTHGGKHPPNHGGGLPDPAPGD